jgi:hypothetical protein
MDVPDGWEVHEREGIIEVVPPVPTGAVHISVLRRTMPDEVKTGEPTAVVENFARKQGVQNPTVTESVIAGEHVAQGRFESADGRGRYSWEVEARVWPRRALICSLSFDGKDETLRHRARRMFQSIEALDGDRVEIT